MKQVKKNIRHEDCKKNEAQEGQKGKEKLETFLLNNDIVLYVENPKELKKLLFELTRSLVRSQERKLI